MSGTRMSVVYPGMKKQEGCSAVRISPKLCPKDLTPPQLFYQTMQALNDELAGNCSVHATMLFSHHATMPPSHGKLD